MTLSLFEDAADPQINLLPCDGVVNDHGTVFAAEADAMLAWLLAENTLQACPIAPLVKTLRLSLPLAALAGACYNFCVYFAAEPQLMGQNPALYENVSRLVQFWL